MRLLVLLLVALAVAGPAHAQLFAPAPRVVMNLAAHPDDEDGATMAYYRHAQDAVVYSVVYTRGEGGQNEIGPDLYERLGALRTTETEHAARVLGTQVWWLNFYDFGFTKWAHEAFTEWSRPRHGFWDTATPVGTEAAGRDTVTARLVYLIRRLKPDVIFTNHDTLTVGPRAQHGQHQAVGLSAWDAFALAADPAYHPEQLEEPGVDLWQPQRLFVRDRSGDGADVAVPVADSCGYSESCSDVAVRAAVLHRTQGFDRLAPRFFRRDTSYFTLYRAAPGAPPLPEGATDMAAGLPPNPHAARASPSYLLDSGRDWRSRTGGYAESSPVVVPGGTIDLQWLARPAPPGIVALRPTGTTDTLALAREDPVGARYVVPPDFRPTLPAARAQYGRMQGSPPIEIEIRGDDVGYVDVEVAPPVVVDLAPAPVRLVGGANTLPVTVRVYDPAATSARLTLRVEGSGGGVLATTSQTVAAGDTTATLVFTLPEGTPPGPARVVIEAAPTPATVAGAAPYVETRPAALLPDIRVARGLRVGFVRSYDETTEQALRAMGAEVVPLDSAALAEGRFDGLDTIVLDIRAYLVRPDLRQHNDRLLDWVRAGGHLVVGYQKTFEWNPGDADPTAPEGATAVNPDFAPYPLVLGRDRVVREDAPVTLLQPRHRVFHSPNETTAADWDGWVQERGLYFPETYDAHYEPLLAMSDPGEAPLQGGLLLARVGRGTYVYSPLVWYRQLEALNPGAWRLFANLVSLGED